MTNLSKVMDIFSDILSKRTKGQQDKGLDTQVKARPRWATPRVAATPKGKPFDSTPRPVGKDDPRGQDYGKRIDPEGLIAPSDTGLANPKVPAKYVTWNAINRHQKREAMRRERMLESGASNPRHRISPSPKDRKQIKENRRYYEEAGGHLWEGEGIYDMEKSRFEQQPIKGNFIPRPDPKKNTTSEVDPTTNEGDTSVLLAKESPRPVPGTYVPPSDPKDKTGGKGKKAGRTFETDASTPDDSTYVIGMEKAKDDEERNGNGGGKNIEAERRAWKTKGTEDWKAYRRAARKLNIPDKEITEGIPPEEWSTSTYERGASTKYPHVSMAHKIMAETEARRKNIQNMLKARENNIYAIATAAAKKKGYKRFKEDSPGEDKREEIVRALKRGKMILKAFGVPISMPGGKQRILPITPNSEGGFFIKETWGKHSLHPVAKRPKTVTETGTPAARVKSDGGEEYASGARGITPALFRMIKARKRLKDMTGKEVIAAHKRGDVRLNRSYRPGQDPHPAYAQKPVQRELPFSTEDRDHIAPTPEPQKPRSHGEDLPQPTQRGGSKQGSKAQKLIPKKDWGTIDKALLWPTQPKDNNKGRKTKARTVDSIGGYPT